ncbi:MAG: TerD family protein [Pseudomonadales bacterium]|nr:TerD family protein [Pseudomonadales bacterium]
MTTANLSKGDEFVIGKPGNDTLATVSVGLGWDVSEIKKKGIFGLGGGKKEAAVDLDASCLLFDTDKNLTDQVSFQQLNSKCRSVVHTGDNKSGDAPGADEVINVNLSKIPEDVGALVFTVNCFSELSFDQITAAFISIFDTVTNQEVARFDLSMDGGARTGLIVGKLYRKGDEWVFQAIEKFEDGHTYVKLVPAIKELL